MLAEACIPGLELVTCSQISLGFSEPPSLVLLLVGDKQRTFVAESLEDECKQIISS